MGSTTAGENVLTVFRGLGGECFGRRGGGCQFGKVSMYQHGRGNVHDHLPA